VPGSVVGAVGDDEQRAVDRAIANRVGARHPAGRVGRGDLDEPPGWVAASGAAVG
jgi:hypothetical protein